MPRKPIATASRAKAVSPRVAAAILAGAIIITCTVEWKSLLAKERRDNPVRVLTLASCTKCHSDAKTIAKMKWKEGDTHFLFDDKTTAFKPGVCPVKTSDRQGYDPAVASWLKQSSSASK